MAPSAEQIAGSFKQAIEQLAANNQIRSRGIDAMSALILGIVTGIDIYAPTFNTLFYYQLVNPIPEKVGEFQDKGLDLFYLVEDGVYIFTVKYRQHKYSITMPYTAGPFFDYTSNTLH